MNIYVGEHICLNYNGKWGNKIISTNYRINVTLGRKKGLKIGKVQIDRYNNINHFSSQITC